MVELPIELSMFIYVWSFPANRPLNLDPHSTFMSYCNPNVCGWFQTWLLLSISYRACHPKPIDFHSMMFQDGYFTTNQKWSYIRWYNPYITTIIGIITTMKSMKSCFCPIILGWHLNVLHQISRSTLASMHWRGVTGQPGRRPLPLPGLPGMQWLEELGIYGCSMIFSLAIGKPKENIGKSRVKWFLVGGVRHGFYFPW